jgi:hypothetical protein
MRINFKKVSAIAASVLMVGMTMGTAVAANYPAPFVAGGAANVAVVYGTGSGVSSLDLIQAGNIQSNLQSYMTGSDGTTVTGGESWQVGTSSDNLEIGESIKDVTAYIGNDELSLLADGIVSNEKGEADYEQFLYFADTASEYVTYAEDSEDNIGLFFKINSGQEIAKYVMDFSTDLKSDIESDGKLSDIEDKSITFLGKTYTITSANNGTGTGGTELTLMSGALGGTIKEGESLTLDGYTVSVVVSSATAAQFTITSSSGTKTTDKLAKGDTEKLSDNNYLAVTDITYEGYADGDQSATFYIGADKIEWKNGQSMTVNGETISDAAVSITDTEAGGDIAISEITINMTAEDDLYVPVGGKLSEATDLDEPQVLVSQNWDVQFAGLEATDYEDLSLKVSGSDKKYTLRYNYYNGYEIVLPLVFTNTNGTYTGEDDDTKFVINGTITKKDYFVLHTADPKLSGSDAKTVLVQYSGADKGTDTNPKVRFLVNPGEAQYTEEVSLTVAATTSIGTATLKVAGGTFTFSSTGNASTADDFDIVRTGTGGYASVESVNATASNYIRTYYNTFINITDMNLNDTVNGGNNDGITGASIEVNVSVDDTNRDGDDFNVPSQVFFVTLGNTSSDASLSYTGTSAWLTDPDDSNVQKYIGRYGYEITSTDPADSPASVEVKIPKDIVTPLVYVTSKEGVIVSSTVGGATQLGDVIVKDSEVSSVSSKNLIVVGGSCINSVAAKLIGGTAACSASFTEKTGVGSGQFLIQSFGDAYTSGKIALLVAGYEVADTVNAATYLRTKTVDTTAGKKYKGTSATTAELVVV